MQVSILCIKTNQQESCSVCWKGLLRELNMDILLVVWGITRISFEYYFFVMLYCDSWPLRKSGLKWELFPRFVRCSLHFAEVVWFLPLCFYVPLLYEDRFIIIILWLGLFPYILINVFLFICFCSVYVIGLFGQCSRVLDPALDTSPLNWDNYHTHLQWIFTTFHDHCLSWIVISKFTTLGYYCSVIYGWLFLISHFYFYLFSFQFW